MKNELKITFEGDYVLAIANGEKDFEFSTKLWTEVVQACRENSCLKVLGIANTTKPLRTMEAYQNAVLFRNLGLTHDFRIAWVELNEESFDSSYFAETVLVNRGMPVRLFTEESQAKEWLLGDSSNRT
jgi:hypothetical protein